jgi:hypothetical protein
MAGERSDNEVRRWAADQRQEMLSGLESAFGIRVKDRFQSQGDKISRPREVTQQI